MASSLIKYWKVSACANVEPPKVFGYQRDNIPNIQGGLLIVHDETLLITRGINLEGCQGFVIEPVYFDESER
jgi:hypothetical protein